MKGLLFTRSIRWRFQLWLAFLLGVLLTGFGITAHRLHRNNQFDQIDTELSRRLSLLGNDVRRPPFGPGDRGGPPPGRDWPRGPRPEGQPDEPSRRGLREPIPGEPLGGGPGGPGGPGDPWMETRQVRLSPATESLFASDGEPGHYFVVWSRGGRILIASSNAPPELALPVRPGPGTSEVRRTRETVREVYQFTGLGECLLVGVSIVPDLAAVRRFGWWLVAGGAAVLAFGLGGGWALVSRALRPVQAISAAASRIAEGNLGERIDTTDTENELGRLAAVLNSTFARLEAAFAQQKQFTADAAHELRTPLAVLISEAQSTLARPRTPGEYRQALEECLSVAQQMRRLTESLLQLARFDAGEEPLERSRIDLADLAREGIELIRPLAAPRHLRIEADLGPAVALGDPQRLAQVVVNLLTNAVHYNRDGGRIRITTSNGDGRARLAVEDTGPGIAAEHLPHLFERFYRVDAARTNPQGRSGLGLAISKAIVDAHAGTLAVSSTPGLGTRFELGLPKATDQPLPTGAG